MKPNTNLMKLSVFGLVTISLIAILISSCAKEWGVSIVTRSYTYYNNSYNQVTIIAFNGGYDSAYIIPSREIISLKMDHSRRGTYNEFHILDADSVLILFDDSRYLFFTEDCASTRNPILLKNYDHQTVLIERHMRSIFEFRITPEDYNSAHLIIEAK